MRRDRAANSLAYLVVVHGLLVQPSAPQGTEVTTASDAERLYGSDVGSCRHWLSPADWARVWAEIHGMPAVLYGVDGSAGVAQAQARLDELGACYESHLSPSGTEDGDPLLQYMRCEVWAAGGVTHPFALRSFVWIGGQFRGDGFALDLPHEGGVDEHLLEGLLADAGAERGCVGGVADGQPACSPDVLTTTASRITDVCCATPAVCDPWPTRCTAACRDLWMPFWTECYSELSEGFMGDEPGLRSLTEFARVCGAGKTTAPAGAVMNDDGPSSGGARGFAEASAEELVAFRPTCGTAHAPCSDVPVPLAGQLPVGVWDVEHCSGGDRFVCFGDTSGNPALFLDENVHWWDGEANPQGQRTAAITGNVKQPAVGCVVETDACASGSAVAIAVDTRPYHQCILGIWRYACVDGTVAGRSGAGTTVCADDDEWLSAHTHGYTCSEIGSLDFCDQLEAHGISWACGCSCRGGQQILSVPSPPTPTPPTPTPTPSPPPSPSHAPQEATTETLAVGCEDASPFATRNTVGAPALSCADLIVMGLTTCDSDAGVPQECAGCDTSFASILVKDMCRVTCDNCSPAAPRTGH